MARVIGIVSGKGGSGKTTVAVNLGAIFARHYGKDVTLVDCNLTTSQFGLHLGRYNYHVTLNHVLRNEYDVEDAIYSHHSGMKVVPSSVSLMDIKSVDVGKLKDVVRKLSTMNDIILLDAAPCLGREAASTFRASDDLLYISNPYMPAVVDIIRSQTLANELGCNPLGIAMNMVSNDKHEMKPHEIEYLTDLPIIATIPYDSHVRHSLAIKSPVIMEKPNSPASRAMFRLAARIVEGEHIEDDITFAGFVKQKLKFW